MPRVRRRCGRRSAPTTFSRLRLVGVAGHRPCVARSLPIAGVAVQCTTRAFGANWRAAGGAVVNARRPRSAGRILHRHVRGAAAVHAQHARLRRCDGGSAPAPSASARWGIGQVDSSRTRPPRRPAPRRRRHRPPLLRLRDDRGGFVQRMVGRVRHRRYRGRHVPAGAAAPSCTSWAGRSAPGQGGLRARGPEGLASIQRRSSTLRGGNCVHDQHGHRVHVQFLERAVPISGVATCPVMTTIGTESSIASAMPVTGSTRPGRRSRRTRRRGRWRA